MKWSEINSNDIGYGAFDENQRAVKGAFLVSLGIDLEKIPKELFQPCDFLDKKSIALSDEYESRINIWEIVGTTHSLYGGETWLSAFLKEHKAFNHILRGNVSKQKYFRLLRKHTDKQMSCIKLIKSKNGNYYVGDNGNHRVTFYMLMYLADLYLEKSHELHKYWLYAEIKNEL